MSKKVKISNLPGNSRLLKSQSRFPGFEIPGKLVAASFVKLDHFRAHMARMHTKNFTKHCRYCNKGFVATSELNDHERKDFESLDQ